MPGAVTPQSTADLGVSICSPKSIDAKPRTLPYERTSRAMCAGNDVTSPDRRKRGANRGATGWDRQTRDLASCSEVSADNVHYVKSWMNSGRVPQIGRPRHRSSGVTRRRRRTKPAPDRQRNFSHQPVESRDVSDRRHVRTGRYPARDVTFRPTPTDPWPSGPGNDFRRIQRSLWRRDRQRRPWPATRRLLDCSDWRIAPAGATGPKKVLLRALELGKVTGGKAPRLKVQSPVGREGEIPAEGLVRDV